MHTTENKVNFITDFWVILQANLVSDLHINRITKEALRNLGFVIRLSENLRMLIMFIKPLTLYAFVPNLNMLQ